jgi:hypothetical protein
MIIDGVNAKSNLRTSKIYNVEVEFPYIGVIKPLTYVETKLKGTSSKSSSSIDVSEVENILESNRDPVYSFILMYLFDAMSICMLPIIILTTSDIVGRFDAL